MGEKLLSLGLDVGTTSTQMVVSELTIENRAGAFAVPEMEIGKREIRYKSPVHFTPLIREELVDAEKLRDLLDEEYEWAGIRKEEVDTGAIIITGETSRKENARAVLEALSSYAGEFVVATAGPELESVLAAEGSGAVEYSAQTGKAVLHMDIGGGTANLALMENGKILGTSCMNVGGRLLKIREDGRLDYVSPVLKGIFDRKVDDYVNQNDVLELGKHLARALEMAAGLEDRKLPLSSLLTDGCRWLDVPKGTVFSFSGGVADCIREERSWLEYGDMGPELGRAIRESRLCRGEYILGKETIRATVIGAGCHSAQLSGSTVFFQNIQFPLKNLPVVDDLRELGKLDTRGVMALEGFVSPGYEAVAKLAQEILDACPGELPVLALEQDMAKALGQQLALRGGKNRGILCIDRVKLKTGDYLDVGAPVGPALPVVVKTLILSK